jgi:hypothetical protein
LADLADGLRQGSQNDRRDNNYQWLTDYTGKIDVMGGGGH